MGRSESMRAYWLAAILVQAFRCGTCLATSQLAIPLGSTTDITCKNVTPPWMRWEVKLNPTMSTLRIPEDNVTLATYGITSSFLISSEVPSSVLHVNATTRNNGTTVKCVRLYGINGLTVVFEVTLAVYEPPSPPTNLSVSVIGNGTLVLKWQPPFAPYGVALLYRVTTYDLLAPSATLETVMVENCSYTRYFAWQISQCPRYGISVLAVNRAGESNPARAQVSLHAAALLADAQHLYKLVYSRDGVAAAYFRLLINQNCSDVRVQSYIVQLYNVLQGSTLTVKCQANMNNCSAEKIIIRALDGLQPNMKYVYNITAVTVYGSSTTSPQILYTTDVQSSTITGSDHQLNVTCFFAEGTLARGCGVCLEKSGEVVYQMIPRVNGTAKGVIRTEFSVDCYNISVVDWEKDGSIGSLITQVTIVVAPVNTTAVNMVAISLTESSIQSIASTAPTTSVSSTYSTYLPLPSHLPTSSTADSSKVERMQWLVPIVCSIAAALFVATVTLLCFVFAFWRMKGKRDKTTYPSSEKEERIYEAVSNQRSIYAILERPLQNDVINPTYMNKYEFAYSSGTAATNEYAIPSDTINEYEIPNNSLPTWNAKPVSSLSK